MSSVPRSVDEFCSWSTEETCGDFTGPIETWYSVNQNNLMVQIQDSEFFADLPTLLRQPADAYHEERGSQLYPPGLEPKVSWNRKTFDSFLEKLYRLNCLENQRFPEPPPSGWVSLDRAFAQIDDIVRTTFYVAYADGPAHLGNYLESAASNHQLTAIHKEHAQDKGYYAHHVYIRMPIPVASRTSAGNYLETDVGVECQIATQLQASLREVTHSLYEQERISGGLPHDWKQDFASGRFRAAYMAHSLRFVEAMIVELRDRLISDRKDNS